MNGQNWLEVRSTRFCGHVDLGHVLQKGQHQRTVLSLIVTDGYAKFCVLTPWSGLHAAALLTRGSRVWIGPQVHQIVRGTIVLLAHVHHRFRDNLSM